MCSKSQGALRGAGTDQKMMKLESMNKNHDRECLHGRWRMPLMQFQVAQHGKTACQRTKNEPVKKACTEFGECAWRGTTTRVSKASRNLTKEKTGVWLREGGSVPGAGAPVRRLPRLCLVFVCVCVFVVFVCFCCCVLCVFQCVFVCCFVCGVIFVSPGPPSAGHPFAGPPFAGPPPPRSATPVLPPSVSDGPPEPPIALPWMKLRLRNHARMNGHLMFS